MSRNSWNEKGKKKRTYEKVNGKIYEIIDSNDDQIGLISEELPYMKLIEVPDTKQTTFTGEDYKVTTKCEECKKRVPCSILQQKDDSNDGTCCICWNTDYIPKTDWENYPEMFCEECWKLFSKKDYLTELDHYEQPETKTRTN